MNRSPTRSTGVLLVATAAFVGVALAACAGKKKPEPMPSQTTTQVTPQLEPPPANLPPPIRQHPIRKPETVKVIEPGGDSGPDNLVEASNLARRRKQSMPPPVAEINDKNLHEHAEGGKVIILADTPAAPPLVPRDETAEPASDPAADVPPEQRDESYWRNRALELRMGWRRAIDEITSLELEAAALRQQFYAEEDVYVRDNQVKPAWDRVLDRLDRLRERSHQLESELDVLISEGRRSDVPQGWLNEGWELEPTPEERDRLSKVEVHEAQPTAIADPAKDVQ